MLENGATSVADLITLDDYKRPVNHLDGHYAQ